MGTNSEIAWCDHTFNPWIGCERVSDGCKNCYAEALSKRWGWGLWGKHAPRRVTSTTNWKLPHRWDKAARRAGRPALVFCASLADVFEDRPDLRQPRHDLFQLIADTPHLRWLLLTKRPQNVLRLVPTRWLAGGDITDAINGDRPLSSWPHTVWVGTTVEHQAAADARIPELLAIPAPVRFISAEPLLGPVDLGMVPDHTGHDRDDTGGYQLVCLDCSSEDEDVRWVVPGGPTIDWVISGGESGAGHRPLDVEHARSLRDQCAAARVPFFFKQDSGPRPGMPGPADLDGHKAFPAEAHR